MQPPVPTRVRLLPYNNLVGENPSGIARGAMPGGDCDGWNGLHPHIADATFGEVPVTFKGDCESLYLRHCKACGVVGMECADGLPAFSILRDIKMDGLREENPREREIEEVKLDLMDTLTLAEVNDGIEGVAIES